MLHDNGIESCLIPMCEKSKRYYQYHSVLHPVTTDIEAVIRQTLLAFGWQAEPIFDSYTEE